MFFSIFLAFLIGGLLWFLNGKRNQKGKRIPGPRGVPVLGNILQFGRNIPKKYAEWAEEYGDIYKIQMGSRNAVVISDPKMIKEIFSQDSAFAGRRGFEGFAGLFPDECLGIAFSDGELWEVHRRFLLRELRDFGFGKSSMEQLIMEEVNPAIERLQRLQKENGSISGLKDVLLIAVLNSLFSIVASKRWEPEDEEVLDMMKSNDRVGLEFASRVIFVLIPWTRMFLPKSKAVDARDRFKGFFENIFNERKKTYKEGNTRDFVDVYLAEMKKNENNAKSQFYGKRAERQLMEILKDLHVAGSDTTASTLTWAVLYLCTFKKAQEKLHKEIGEVTGDSRQVSITDRPHMPYTLALIDEVFRYSSLFPSGLQHSALQDKDFKGYWIEKDTWIIPNLYFVHHSEKIWGDPKNFRPERFLSKDGTKYEKNENLLPFGIGRRQCIGESLARDSVFLFLTNIFQKFEMDFDQKGPEPSLEPDFNTLFQPKPFSVVLKERN